MKIIIILLATAMVVYYTVVGVKVTDNFRNLVNNRTTTINMIGGD